MPTIPTANTNSAALRASQQAGGSAAAAGDSRAELAPARREYAELRAKVSLDYEALGGKIQDLTRSAQAGARVLGSKALFRLVATVSTAIERLCRLETGRLTSRLVGNTPLVRSLQEQDSALQGVARALGELDRQVEGMADGKALTASEKSALLAQLDRVEESVEEFQNTINYHYADTEEVQRDLFALNGMATHVLMSVDHYRRSVAESSSLPPASTLVDPGAEGGAAGSAQPGAGAAGSAQPGTGAAGTVAGQSAPAAGNVNRASTGAASAQRHFRIKPHSEAQTPTIIEERSPDPVAPGKAFYREKQKDSSGLCGMHALNAFCGGPVIGKNEFTDRIVEFTAPRIGMQPDDYRNMVGEQFDSSPEAVAQVLSDLADAERADPAWKNIQALTSLKTPAPGTPAQRQMADRINAFPGDRMILSYSGGHGADGHLVALRRDTGGNWQEVNSLDYVKRAQPIPDLGQYITGKTGVSLIHAEPDFSLLETRPAAPGRRDAPAAGAAARRPAADAAPPPVPGAPRPQQSAGQPPPASGAHYGALTPGKVEGENPLFYRERQSQRLCVKHALNAFMGGPVVDRSDLVRIHKERNIENFSDIIRAQVADGHTFERIAADHALPVELVRQLMATGGPRRVAEAELAVLAELVPDAYDSEQYVVRGNLIEVATDAINSKKDALGVPEASYKSFPWQAGENDIIAFVRERQEQTDRFAVGSGAHYFAFRKAANGNWYQLDSIGDKQQVQSPLEYTQQRIWAENREPALRVYGLPRFEFVTFPAEVSPRLGNPLLTGADRV